MATVCIYDMKSMMSAIKIQCLEWTIDLYNTEEKINTLENVVIETIQNEIQR